MRSPKANASAPFCTAIETLPTLLMTYWHTSGCEIAEPAVNIVIWQ